MFHNMMQSGSKYLITTTFPDVTVNDPLEYSNQEVSGRRSNIKLFRILKKFVSWFKKFKKLDIVK